MSNTMSKNRKSARSREPVSNERVWQGQGRDWPRECRSTAPQRRGEPPGRWAVTSGSRNAFLLERAKRHRNRAPSVRAS
jgi:hypothetical protein